MKIRLAVPVEAEECWSIRNQVFYEKHGFILVRESMYRSALAQAELRCMEMSIKLQG